MPCNTAAKRCSRDLSFLRSIQGVVEADRQHWQSMHVCMQQFAKDDHAADKCLQSDSDAKGISQQISHMSKISSSRSCHLPGLALNNTWFERPRCVSDTTLVSLHSRLGWRCWSSAPIAGNHTVQSPRLVFLVCCTAVTASVLVA